MGFGLNDLIKVGTLGIVDDPFGTEGAQRANERAISGQQQLQREMFDENMAFQREQFAQQRADVAPWMAAGQRGLAGLESLMRQGTPQMTYKQRDLSDLTQDPLYAQRIAEQTNALERSGAARGGLLGGGTLASLRDMTANEMGQAYNRNLGLDQLQYGRAVDEYNRMYGSRQDELNRYASLAGVGQSAAQGMAGMSQQYAGNVGNLMASNTQAQQQLLGNLGQVQAAGAVAPFQNLMSLGTLGAGIMTGMPFGSTTGLTPGQSRTGFGFM